MKADIIELAKQLSTAKWKLENAEEDLACAKQRMKVAKEEFESAVDNLAVVYRKDHE